VTAPRDADPSWPDGGRARFVAVVAGRVQGVGFRFFAQERARARRLAGSVRNLPSGSVEVDAEGPDEVLRGYLEELHQGPPAARVSDVTVRWLSAQGARDFVIRTS
jgi:acylphosphatase